LRLQHAQVQRGAGDVIAESRDRRGRANHRRHHCSSDVDLTWLLLLLLLMMMPI